MPQLGCMSHQFCMSLLSAGVQSCSTPAMHVPPSTLCMRSHIRPPNPKAKHARKLVWAHGHAGLALWAWGWVTMAGCWEAGTAAGLAAGGGAVLLLVHIRSEGQVPEDGLLRGTGLMSCTGRCG